MALTLGMVGVGMLIIRARREAKKDAEFSHYLAQQDLGLNQEQRSGFSEFFLTHHDRVAGFLKKKYKLSSMTAEDLASTAFLNILKHWADYGVKPQEEQEKILHRTATNVTMDLLKKKTKEIYILDAAEKESDTSLVENLENPGTPILDSIIEQETGLELIEGIKKIKNPRAKTVLFLYLVGLEAGEIAEVVGMRDGAVRAQIHRSISNLRKIMEAKEKLSSKSKV